MNQTAATSRFSELTLSLQERLHTPTSTATEDICTHSQNLSSLANSRNISTASLISRDSPKSLVGLDVQENDAEDAGLLIGDAFIETACSTTTTPSFSQPTVSIGASRTTALHKTSMREAVLVSSEYDALFLAPVPQPSSASQPRSPTALSVDQLAQGKKKSNKRPLQETAAAGTDVLQVIKLAKTSSNSSSSKEGGSSKNKEKDSSSSSSKEGGSSKNKEKDSSSSSISKKLKTSRSGSAADKEKKSKKKSRDKGNTGDAIDDIFGF